MWVRPGRTDLGRIRGQGRVRGGSGSGWGWARSASPTVSGWGSASGWVRRLLRDDDRHRLADVEGALGRVLLDDLVLGDRVGLARAGAVLQPGGLDGLLRLVAAAPDDVGDLDLAGPDPQDDRGVQRHRRPSRGVGVDDDVLLGVGVVHLLRLADREPEVGEQTPGLVERHAADVGHRDGAGSRRHDDLDPAPLVHLGPLTRVLPDDDAVLDRVARLAHDIGGQLGPGDLRDGALLGVADDPRHADLDDIGLPEVLEEPEAEGAERREDRDASRTIAAGLRPRSSSSASRPRPDEGLGGGRAAGRTPAPHRRRAVDARRLLAASRGSPRWHRRRATARSGTGERSRRPMGGVGDRPAQPDGREVAAELVGGLVPGVAGLGQGVEDDGVDVLGELLGEPRRRDRRLAHVLVGDGDRAVAGERRPAGQQLEEHAAGGVQVGARVDGLALGLLGREVLRRADDGLGLGHRRVGVGHRAGDAEVHDLDGAVVGDHDVRGLDVAVDDAVAVAVGEGVEDPLGDAEGLGRRQRAALGEDLAQGPAVDVLHDDEGHLDLGAPALDEGVLAVVVDGDDGGVVEPGGRLGLAPEPGDERLVAGEVAAEHLDGDLPPQT